MLRVRADDQAAIAPEAVRGMSDAFKDIRVEDGGVGRREAVASRVIGFAGRGVQDPAALRARVPRQTHIGV